MREYAKRTKSTKSKSYYDYLQARLVLEDKGYELKDAMSKEAYLNYYERVKQAKKTGEIKSSPWQYLMAKERYVSEAQAQALAKAASELYGRKVTAKEVKGMKPDQIKWVGTYLSEHKNTIWGGRYE